MIQLALYQYYGELFFIRKQKNIVNQALIRRYQICYTLQKTTHYRLLCGEPHKICNEEGKLMGLPLNRSLTDDNGEIYDIIAGNFILTGLTEDNFGDLSPELMEKFSEQFKHPEEFVRIAGKILGVKQPVPGESEPKKSHTGPEL